MTFEVMKVEGERMEEMIEYEYKVLTVEDLQSGSAERGPEVIQRHMNRLGEKGWQLMPTNGSFFTFMREKVEEEVSGPKDTFSESGDEHFRVVYDYLIGKSSNTYHLWLSVGYFVEGAGRHAGLKPWKNQEELNHLLLATKRYNKD